MAAEEPINVHKAILNVSKKVGAIGKDSRNQQQGFNFRGIDDLIPHIQKAMIEEGLTMIPRVINAQGDTREAKSGGTLNVSAVTVNYLLTGPDGTFVESVMTGESADSGDKSMSKAISMATKYFLFYTFWIPVYGLDTGDKDSYEFGRSAAAGVAEGGTQTTPRPAPQSAPARTQNNARTPATHQNAIAAASQRTQQSASSGDAITKPQFGKIMNLAGTMSTETLFDIAGKVVGHPIGDLKDLTKREASSVIEWLLNPTDLETSDEEF
jgi:hypothetical protein